MSITSESTGFPTRQTTTAPGQKTAARFQRLWWNDSAAHVSLSGLTRQSFFLPIQRNFIKFYKMDSYYIYILSNFSNTTLYIGVTNNLQRRLNEHKT
ncbi:MAG: GIY-YIG nuclease family protein, partial [Treponema sp.]|nr:GIY-YIG nuclease family protein [Treponema sp.]